MPPRRGPTTDKPQNPKVALTRLLKDFHGQRSSLIFIVFLLTICSLLYVIEPVVLGNVLNHFDAFVDSVGTTHVVLWGKLLLYFGIYLGLILGSNFSGWLSGFLGVKLAGNYAYRLNNSLKQKLDSLPLAYFDSQSYGDILSKGTNDIDNIRSNVFSILSQTIQAAVMLLGSLGAMFYFSWQLALVLTAFLPLMGLAVYRVSRHNQKNYRAYRARYGVLEGMVEEIYNGYRLIKIFNQEKPSVQRFDDLNDQMTDSDRRAQTISGLLSPLMRFISLAAFVAIAVASGLIYVDSSGSNIGTLVAFLLFLNIVTQPLQMLGSIVSTYQSVVVSLERIFKLLDAPEEEPDPPDAIQSGDGIRGHVVFQNVFFSYSPEKPLIANMNLDIQSGETVAIVGPTGAGKTTLVNLLMRFYEINSGTILLDGIDIRKYSRFALRGAIGMVLQDTWLFSGSIRENIRYGNSEATDADVEAAAKAARVDHFITTLPGGYDFELNEDGTNISQGQRQLLTIARAICSKPKIMILDEATSSVDTRTEQAIQEDMSEIMAERTSFVIAHRLSTIKNAKTILVMNSGAIVEMGTHQELLAKNGFYTDLYNSQFLGRDLSSAGD